MAEKYSSNRTFDGNLRIVLCSFMFNDFTIFFASEVGHSEFGMTAIIYALIIVFIGIPLIYSEIAVAQYTNCDAITVWNFFPLFRGVGYASFYLIFLKSVNTMILIAWYMNYAYMSLFNPPPWFTGEDLDSSHCMVKWRNVSMFHYCLELENIYGVDCNMETASNCIFDRAIGDVTTKLNWPECTYKWYNLLYVSAMALLLLLSSAKKTNFLVNIIRYGQVYILAAVMILFCATLLANGTWNMSTTFFEINDYYYAHTIVQGFATMSTGYGITFYIFRKAPFRNSALMTAISSAMFILCIVLMYGHITMCATKMMVTYHGGDLHVIETADKQFFVLFASMTEVLSYISGRIIAGSCWVFLWFSSMLASLVINQVLLYNYMKDSLLYYNLSCNHYQKIISVSLILVICGFACIFICSDLAIALVDALVVLQTVSSLFFSVALYWFYGFRKHNVDLVFMLGIKASYFWRISWVLNPIFLLIILFCKVTILEIYEYETSSLIEAIDKYVNEIVFAALIGIYIIIVLWGSCSEVFFYCRYDLLKQLFRPTDNWGPKDKILFKSRKMFVPEIMTREFLYRQVKHQGYMKNKAPVTKPTTVENVSDSNEDETCEQQDAEIDVASANVGSST